MEALLEAIRTILVKIFQLLEAVGLKLDLDEIFGLGKDDTTDDTTV